MKNRTFPRPTSANPMSLIIESVIDPASFLKRRECWLGETSRKNKEEQSKQPMKGSKAQRRNEIRSAIYTLSNSIFMYMLISTIYLTFFPYKNS